MMQFLFMLICVSSANPAVVVEEAASLLQPVIPASETLLQTFVGEDVKVELDVDVMVEAAPPSPAPSHQMMNQKTIDLMRSQARSAYLMAAQFFAWEAMKRTEFHLLAAKFSDPSTMKIGFQVATKAARDSFQQLQSSADQLAGQKCRFKAYKEVADAEGLPWNETTLELRTQWVVAQTEMDGLNMSKTHALAERQLAEAALSLGPFYAYYFLRLPAAMQLAALQVNDVNGKQILLQTSDGEYVKEELDVDDVMEEGAPRATTASTISTAGCLQAQKMIDHMQSEVVKSRISAADLLQWEATKVGEFEELAAKFSDPTTMRVQFQATIDAVGSNSFSRAFHATRVVEDEANAFSAFEKGAKGAPSDAKMRQHHLTKAQSLLDSLDFFRKYELAKVASVKAALSLGPIYANYFLGLPAALRVKDVNGTKGVNGTHAPP